MESGIRNRVGIPPGAESCPRAVHAEPRVAMPLKGSRAYRAKNSRDSQLISYPTLLKKPLDHLGKQVNVPGSFWQGRPSA